MSKRIVSLLLAAFMLFGTLQPISVFAATENESEVIDRIDSVKTEYEPNKTFFVSHSEDLTRMVGEDNIDGDKTQGCFTPGTKNSHGRFGDLWQSNGFANYVFNTAFGNIPRSIRLHRLCAEEGAGCPSSPFRGHGCQYKLDHAKLI